MGILVLGRKLGFVVIVRRQSGVLDSMGILLAVRDVSGDAISANRGIKWQ